MKNCNGDPARLREILPRHYQDDHLKCLPESRCKMDEEYECSKCIIQDPIPIRLLTKAIRKLQIYKTPTDYACCVDTHCAESYNNATLVYHDKRISFGEKEYKRRTYLSVLDWNENQKKKKKKKKKNYRVLSIIAIFCRNIFVPYFGNKLPTRLS